MPSKVGVKGLKLKCRVGVDPGEELFDRTIFADIIVELADEYKGGLGSTVSYSELAKKVRERVEGKRFELIEDVAREIAGAIKEFRNVKSFKIKVVKPYVPEGASRAFFVYEEAC